MEERAYEVPDVAVICSEAARSNDKTKCKVHGVDSLCVFVLIRNPFPVDLISPLSKSRVEGPF